MNKIGLVLSGGGIRGIAHLGLLKALDELGVKPSAISGVSAGAIIGAMYASGKSPDEILAIGKSNINLGFSNLLWRKGGLFSRQSIHKLLIENIPHNSFGGLHIPLFVNATDFIHNKTVFFSEGELIPCLEASASVPILFSPAELDGRKLVDGGLLNNFPIEPLMGICDKILGSHVNRLEEFTDTHTKFSRFAIMERCYHMSIANSVYSKAHYCDLFIEPHLYGFGMFDTRRADEIFEIGYNTAMKEKAGIMKLTR
ncbi:MAG: patatin-like phospholipase family protein [Ginsengibacter sp.]